MNIGRHHKLSINGTDAPIQYRDKHFKRSSTQCQAVFDQERGRRKCKVRKKSENTSECRPGQSEDGQVLPMPLIWLAVKSANAQGHSLRTSRSPLWENNSGTKKKQQNYREIVYEERMRRPLRATTAVGADVEP